MKFIPHYNNHFYYNNKTLLNLDDLYVIASSLGGARKYGSGYMCRCPAHNGHDSNLSISLSNDGIFLAHCFSHGCEFNDIIKAIQDIGLLPSYTALKYKSTQNNNLTVSKDIKNDTTLVNKIWNECLPSTGTVVEEYLKVRGYTGIIPKVIRYQAHSYHKIEQSYYPAMIASVTRWPNKEIVGIHRTFLKNGGKNKANINPNKMMLGSTSGGAVRLTEVAQKLILAEGIETALSVYLATGLPTWATLSTSGMVNVIVPPFDITQTIIIAADNDDPGRRAAYKLADRLLKNGYHASITMPPEEGKDFNDLLLGDVTCP